MLSSSPYLCVHRDQRSDFSLEELIAILRLSNMWEIPSGRSFVLPRLEAHQDLSYTRMLRLSLRESSPLLFSVAFCGIAGVITDNRTWSSLNFQGSAPNFKRVASTSMDNVFEELGTYWAEKFLQLLDSRLRARVEIAKRSDLSWVIATCPEHCRGRFKELLDVTRSTLVGWRYWILSSEQVLDQFRRHNVKGKIICGDCFETVFAEYNMHTFCEDLYASERQVLCAGEADARPPTDSDLDSD